MKDVLIMDVEYLIDLVLSERPLSLLPLLLFYPGAPYRYSILRVFLFLSLLSCLSPNIAYPSDSLQLVAQRLYCHPLRSSHNTTFWRLLVHYSMEDP